MEILGGLIDGGGWNSFHRTDDDMGAPLPLLRWQDPNIRNRIGEECVDAVLRMTRNAGRHQAACANHFDIGFAEPATADALRENAADLVAADGQCQAQLGTGAFEPVEMVFQPEEFPVPDGHHVISHIGLDEAPIEDGNLRLVDRDVLAVHVGDALAQVRHDGRPLRRLWQLDRRGFRSHLRSPVSRRAPTRVACLKQALNHAAAPGASQGRVAPGALSFHR